MSENGADFRKTSSKKRGRPSLLSAYTGEYVECAQLLLSNGAQTTNRGKQNHYYSVMGMVAIPEDDPRFEWLFVGNGEVRRTILAELGRISQSYDKETVRGLALEICRAKMTTRKAVRLLRQWRGVKKPVGEVDAAMAIRTAVNNYFKSHPDFTVEQMGDALRAVLEAMEDLCALKHPFAA